MDDSTSDALNNLISSIKEKMNESNTNISETLNEEKKDNNDNSNTNTNVNNSNSFDPDMLLKIQKIMGAMNGNNDKKNLLLSLKPFLRKTRQDKINEYINILNIISALDSFKKGRD